MLSSFHPVAIGVLLALSLGRCRAATESAGLAAAWPGDAGLARHPDVLFYEDFEGASPNLLATPWSRETLREAVKDSSLAFQGGACLANQNLKGKHVPFNTFHEIAECDAAYLRFHTRFEEGYDFGGGLKGPGLLAAKDKGLAAGGGAGIKPMGDDKFGARVCFHGDGAPYLYYYHMDMGRWGSNGDQNIGAPAKLVPGRWYAIELLLKANDPAERNGELKLWIDGELKGHHRDIRWRTTDKLNLNYVTHSAYFGGEWTSPKDQKRFDDSIVVAKAYIGPLRRAAAPPAPLAAPKFSAPAPVVASQPKLDPAPHREAARELLQTQAARWPVSAHLRLWERAARCQVAGADRSGLTLVQQGNRLPVKWSEIRDDDLARLLQAACPRDAGALGHALKLAEAGGAAALAAQLGMELAQALRE
ncbi:MAG: polysaccharide lyase [Planctomycetota bacterium]|nr:polysaccharide lyase [Planctomycetota bacterium]